MLNYKTRHAEQKILQLAKNFKIILVLGARQVGKSTLLKHMLPDIKMFVFDPVQDLFGARQDPDLFLNNFKSPIILDEVQFAPELLAALKRKTDLNEAKGQYFLTGSQNINILRSVSESMAGRVGILQLEGLTAAELSNLGEKKTWLDYYLTDPCSLIDKIKIINQNNLLNFLWQGALPGLINIDKNSITDYFYSYVSTYIERDIRSIENIKDISNFNKFVALTAALTGQEINASQFGRDINVSPTTIKKWLNILLSTYQWKEIPPYHGNTIKRLSGKSKGFFCDTGLTCYLQRISSPEALAVNPLLGSLFETWAINDIQKQFVTLSTAPKMYHWRTSAGAEVDLLLERDGKFYPIEIKCKTNLTSKDTRGIKAFRETYPKLNIMTGLIIYAGDTCYKVNDNVIALPWDGIC